MKDRNAFNNSSESMGKTLRKISGAKRAPIAGFIVLLVLYVASSVITHVTSSSNDFIMILGSPTPLRSLTGAVSSIGNISIILLALFYGKLGFIVSLIILLCQFPVITTQMVMMQNYANLSGIAMNILTIVAVILIYTNNRNAKQYQERILDQAVTDRLTGLPNRFGGSELMSDLIRRNRKFVVASLNLNNFKSINTTMGQQTGNDVITETADRLKAVANERLAETADYIISQGGDEFAIIIRDYENDEEVRQILEKYEEKIEEKITLDSCDYYMNAGIGYAEFPEDARDSDSLLSCANAAMQSVKKGNLGHGVCRYSKEMLNEEHLLETERKIRNALDHDTLFFNLQPQYDMNHKLIGFEALARMKDEDGSVVSPAEFIPVAEKVGLIDQIDNVVFKKSVKFLGEMIEETKTDIKLSVNVSVKHLMKNSFLDEVREVLETSGVPAGQIEIEITESIMIDSAEKALECIRSLKDLGLKVAIDDFGTGYSSLSYLNSFPADLLKVDKSFIDQMNVVDSSVQYVAAIISMGHVMNFHVISEGVETPEQLEILNRIGCDFIQGFLWGRPMEPKEAGDLVRQAAG